MTKKVESITEDCSAAEAWHFMRAHRFHHLVVKRGAAVVGVISERDLGGRNGRAVREGKSIGDLMTPFALTADPRTPVVSAARLLRGRSLGCLPVMRRDKLLGIVTLTDLLDLVGKRASAGTKPKAPPRRTKRSKARRR
ncbi:MAG: CBS domain-containing protein [Planctomycetes bacterium]|nr:CBS domain-containing protein [Planctomycetota bacterium]